MIEDFEQNIFSNDEWHSIIQQLSVPKRQSEVLKLVFHGYSDKQIANRLDIAMPTVRTYMHRLFNHFDVQDRHELVVCVFSHFRSQCRNMPGCPRNNHTDNTDTALLKCEE